MLTTSCSTRNFPCSSKRSSSHQQAHQSHPDRHLFCFLLPRWMERSLSPCALDSSLQLLRNFASRTCLVVGKTWPANAGGAGSIPGQGTKIPHALWPKDHNRKLKNIATNSIKVLKMVHQKKKKGTALPLQGCPLQGAPAHFHGPFSRRLPSVHRHAPVLLPEPLLPSTATCRPKISSLSRCPSLTQTGWLWAPY